MPSSPQTPRHSRNTSAADAYSSPSSNRRESRSSINEPSTPLRGSFSHGDSAMDISVFASGGHHHSMSGGGGDGGLGNLADELAGAFSDDEDDGEYYDGEHGGGDGGAPNISIDGDGGDGTEQATRDSGVDVGASTTSSSPGNHGGDGGGGSGGNRGHKDKARNMSLSLPEARRPNHRRAGSEYDGSEYGSDSDLDSPGMPPSLVAKIDLVESLARRGTENNGGPTDGVFIRVTDGLRDLGSQAGVEGGATRLITAHNALTSHMTNQAKHIQTLSYPLFAPMAPPPDAEVVDELLPCLASLSESIPRPQTSAYNSLAALHAVTTDLVQTLNYLSDTLHMSRQTTNTAARRLRGAKEIVAEMRREEEAREEGERWLTRGNWGERLRKRECAAVCGDVVGGFEEVCNSWRARILAQSGVPAEAAAPA